MVWRSRPCVGALAFIAFSFAAAVPATAQAEYRAFWVDTFNTSLNNHADVVRVVNQAKAANSNAIFAQVRRRGDAWYLNSLEPPPDPNTITAGFDPLQDLISEGHAAGLEIHAFVIVGAVWNRHPVTLGPPASPLHVFNRHGGFDPLTGTIVQGPDNWLTRTLLPGFAFQGHRFGNDFWMEPGHPDAAADTVDVLMHLVANYDIDGLHLDRIRYPEFSATGQTPANGTNIGYNHTNIARFNRHYGVTPDNLPPATGDVRWTQWRRDQVTNLVRRIYLNAIAVKPQLKVSAALIAFGAGPVGETSWPTVSEAHWRVYQDWRSWTEEGILDLAIPMNYKREHIAAQQTQFNQWLEWTRNHQYGRAALIGQGAFVNGIEGTLRQVRRSLAPSATTGNKVGGVIFFSMATSNVFTNNGATVPVALRDPHSIPPNQFTPTRTYDEFASGLTTGKSVDGATLYEDPLANPLPVFSFPAPVPIHAWKVNPQVGHLKGFVRTATGTTVDTAAIRIEREGTDTPLVGRTVIANATDGGGFYGGVDLAPGTYRVTVTPVGETSYASCAATAVVTAGVVSTLDVIVDRALPASSIAADPSQLWPPNGQQATVNISGDATDVGTGVSSITFRVVDEYGEVEPLIPAIAGSGAPFVRWSKELQLQAFRRGEDRDGRTYTIEVTVTDGACNTRTATTTVVVPHDRRAGTQ
jgi:uncharacterized lipoprotein YddW (UPF0748 family)